MRALELYDPETDDFVVPPKRKLVQHPIKRRTQDTTLCTGELTYVVTTEFTVATLEAYNDLITNLPASVELAQSVTNSLGQTLTVCGTPTAC